MAARDEKNRKRNQSGSYYTYGNVAYELQPIIPLTVCGRRKRNGAEKRRALPRRRKEKIRFPLRKW